MRSAGAKEKMLFVTSQEFADIKEAGYNDNDACEGGKVQIVESLDNSDGDNEDVSGHDNDGADHGDANHDDSDSDNQEEKSNEEPENVDEGTHMERLYEDMEVPDWAKYKPLYEEEDNSYEQEHDEVNQVEQDAEVPEARKQDNDADEEEHSQEVIGEVGEREDWTKPIIDSSDSEEADEQKARVVRKTYVQFVRKKEVQLGLQTRFKDAKVFRGILKSYAADKGFSYHFTKNEPKQIGVVCKEEDCNFYIWCSKVKGSTDLEIKTFLPDHTCEKPVNNDRITSDWLAERFLEEIKESRNMDVKTLQRMVYREYTVNISIHKAYRAIRMARTIIGGDKSVQYERLHDYLDMITKTNPDSRWKLMVEHHAEVGEKRTTTRFLRLYIRFGPEKKGFIDGCRPFVGIDGCHLKGYYGGQLLSVVAWDANDGMFPLAYAIVEQENKASWKWFLEQFFEDFGENEDRGWVFISDKQKGLVELFKDWIPHVEHRFCMRHMYENWYKEFKSESLKIQLWKCAKANSAHKFEKEMKILKGMDNEAYEWLKARPAKEWCKAFFTHRACSDIQTNSLSECFNSWILEGREMGIIDLCEFLRVKLMNRFYAKKTTTKTWKGLICPKIKLLLEYNKKDSRNCFVVPSGGGFFEVEEGADKFCVSLEGRTCSCIDFQFSGLPCRHAMAAIVKSKHMAEIYVSKYYHVDTFKRIYEGQIYPVPGMDDWPSCGRETVHPPIIQKPPGRPRLRRKRNKAEVKNPYKASRKGGDIACSRCGERGHNTRSCTPKDYGESPAERIQRKKGNGKTTTKTSASSSKAPSEMTFTMDMNKKRMSAKRKLEKLRKKPSKEAATSGTTNECTPSEIEAKRQAALQRQAERNAQLSQPWIPGINRPKRQKLTIMSKAKKKNPQAFEQNPELSASSTPIPSCGLAGQALNEVRAGFKKQFMPPLGSSRFASEASFSRTSNRGSISGHGEEGQASTQPPPQRASTERAKKGKKPSSSQP